MFLSPWRKLFLLVLFLSISLIVTTDVGRTQPLADKLNSPAGSSSITICLDNGLHPDPITFSGDLGSFALVGPNACHATSLLNAGTYTIIETLPSPWFASGSPSCSETAGSGASQWQTTLLSATIDLAAASAVQCTFFSLPNPDEPNDSMAQATLTNYGATIVAAIGPHPDVAPEGDIDFYRFQGYGGDTLFIDGDVYWFSGSGNYPLLVLRDAGGNIIAQATNLGSPWLSLEYQLPATGDYYLEMKVPCTSGGTSCTGEYAHYLTLRDPYEPNDTPATAEPINFNDVLRANINNYTGDPIASKDYDYFRFQGMAGDEVLIEVSRFNDGLLPGCRLLDMAESLLASDFGPTCRIEFTLPADGLYYINVFSHYNESLHRLDNFYWRGPYALSLQYKNNAPQANPDRYKVFAAETLAVSAPGVLNNDNDADEGPLTAVLTTDVQYGDLNLLSDGSLTYKPDSGYIGPDSFQYYAFDGIDQSQPVDVSITVEPHLIFLPLNRSG